MKVLILDGHPTGENQDYEAFLSGFSRDLEQKGHEVKRQILRSLDIRFCTGCWSCWWASPGECVFKDDSHDVCRAYINSDLVLFASPLIMGFVSALMKKVEDKLIPLIHPYIEFVQGESHHRKRYDTYPKIGLLLQKTSDSDDEDIEITRDMFKRFALNLRTELAVFSLVSQTAKEASHAVDSL
jgi:multimeric flavodoxin WrbA